MHYMFVLYVLALMISPRWSCGLCVGATCLCRASRREKGNGVTSVHDVLTIWHT